jgi:hypothetical protein
VLPDQEVRGQRCACVEYTRNKATPASFCYCGHKTYGHALRKEDNDIEKHKIGQEKALKQETGEITHDLTTKFGELEEYSTSRSTKLKHGRDSGLHAMVLKEPAVMIARAIGLDLIVAQTMGEYQGSKGKVLLLCVTEQAEQVKYRQLEKIVKLQKGEGVSRGRNSRQSRAGGQ